MAVSGFSAPSAELPRGASFSRCQIQRLERLFASIDAIVASTFGMIEAAPVMKRERDTMILALSIAWTAVAAGIDPTADCASKTSCANSIRAYSICSLALRRGAFHESQTENTLRPQGSAAGRFEGWRWSRFRCRRIARPL